MMRRWWLPLAILLAFSRCRDAAAPLASRGAAAAQFSTTTSPTTVHILEQAPTAPRLETYSVSVWAYMRKESMVQVNYQPTAGQSVGDPFLRFDIAHNGLVAGAGGAPLKPGDSVLITLTIDSLSFAVHFEPDGVLFSTKDPATLAMWYAHANLDLNGDGVVDYLDMQLVNQLSFWYHGKRWSVVPSSVDTKQQVVRASLYHLSDYALSW